MPNIVCLGGGNAMPKVVLAGLKNKPVKISAICAMLDSGGSSGRLRRDYGIRAPGDIRRALIALANTSPVIEDLFNFRFEIGELAGHNFANLLITALELNLHDYERAVEELKKLLNIRHEVLPVTLDKSNVYARLENGKVIQGEKNIDQPSHNSNLRIREVFLKPLPKVYLQAKERIIKADLIVIGPGDLYSTIAQILLVQGVKEAIQKRKGKLVYISNLMTKKGETNNFFVSDFVAQIENWLEGEVDYVLYNNFFPENRIKEYKKKHPELLSIVKPKGNLDQKKFIGENLIFDNNLIEHDPNKVAEILLSFI